MSILKHRLNGKSMKYSFTNNKVEYIKSRGEIGEPVGVVGNQRVGLSDVMLRGLAIQDEAPDLLAFKIYPKITYFLIYFFKIHQAHPQIPHLLPACLAILSVLTTNYIGELYEAPFQYAADVADHNFIFVGVTDLENDILDPLQLSPCVFLSDFI